LNQLFSEKAEKNCVTEDKSTQL